MGSGKALLNDDMVAGLIFTILGVGTVLIGIGYPLGSAARMGPGLFPTCAGAALALSGIAISARSFKRGEAIAGIHLRPLISILGSVVVFGLTLQPLGILAASVLLVVISSLASEQFHVRSVVVLSVVLAVAVALVFVWGLGMPVPVWPNQS